MIVWGIDPGNDTGRAIYTDGVLTHLDTWSPVNLLAYLRIAEPAVMPSVIVFEDSRLTSKVFAAEGSSHSALLKVARNVGMVDGRCTDLVATCQALGIMAIGISPKDKGPKLDAAAFNRITNWQGGSNQHERDAGMIGRRYRNARVG